MNPLSSSSENQVSPDRVQSDGSGSASVFPTGEARSVNIGTAKKPCWVIEGPKPNRADAEWSREVPLAALDNLSSPTQNPGTSATANAAQAVALTGDADAESGDASGECAGEDSLLKFTAKIERGEGLTMSERLQRQGLIFNHAGRCGGPLVTTARKSPLNTKITNSGA